MHTLFPTGRPLDALCRLLLLSQPNIYAFDLPENSRTPSRPGPQEGFISAPRGWQGSHSALAPPAQRGLVFRSPAGPWPGALSA